jgi:hypothetical protein
MEREILYVRGGIVPSWSQMPDRSIVMRNARGAVASDFDAPSGASWSAIPAKRCSLNPAWN